MVLIRNVCIVYEPSKGFDVVPGRSASDAKSCFPKDARVLLASGIVKRMDELDVGDQVHVGHGRFSTVFMFTHRVSHSSQQFVSIESSSGTRLRATAGHFLYINGGIRPAGSVSVGDEIELGDGNKDVVSRVSIVSGSGLYNPQTVDGDIVVDGIRASTYTTAVDPILAHAILAPMRVIYRLFGWQCILLENGWSILVM
jgi:hypothetical protein